MARYTPFLKLKANEVAAVATLSDEVGDRVVPFFDLPMKKGMTSATFRTMVQKSAKKVVKLLGAGRVFYLDNFDIPDAISVDGVAAYGFVIDEFAGTAFIPVVGLNRTQMHNNAIFEAKVEGRIASPRAAIRLVAEEFEDFDLVEDELVDLLNATFDCFDECVLILDCRLCLNAKPHILARQISEFLRQAEAEFEFVEVIVTGSSVPSTISEVVKVNQESELVRVELQVFEALRQGGRVEHLGFGDYTIVSPYYSEVTLPPEMMLNVTVPKVMYPHGSVHYIVRGKGALKAHERGNLQYNDMLAAIVKMPFYRGRCYSYGDEFIADKAQYIGSMVTPGSILKPTINAHITYMVMGHPLFA